MNKEDKEKLKKWLSWWAANCKECTKMAVFESDEVSFGICCPPKDVQLYRCAREIAELLDIPHEVRTKTYCGEKKLEVSFMYNGVEFFGLEDCDAGEE